MSANVETMFYVNADGSQRNVPWHGLGTPVTTAPTSREALIMAGLDWNVKQTDVVPYYQLQQIIADIKFAMTMGEDVSKYVHQLEETKIDGYKANYRETDNKVLGMVTNRYRVCQNLEAFDFVDSLLGEGVTYETAGSLASGKRIWLLGRMPERSITDEKVSPYLVFTNSHDGKGAINVAMTPIRVVCQNTLNLALRKATRKWSCAHKGYIAGKLAEARMTLANANNYLDYLEEEFGELKMIKMDEDKVWEYLKLLFPIDGSETNKKADWMTNARLEVFNDWNKPDLASREKSAFRFINAVSDFATHSIPMKRTKNYQENLFMKTADGNPLIDKAYELVGALR